MTPAYAVMHLLFCLHGQLLAASLSSLLSGLDVHEDVFSLGHLSSLVATQLGGLAETQARRKVSYLAAMSNVCFTLPLTNLLVCGHVQKHGCRHMVIPVCHLALCHSNHVTHHPIVLLAALTLNRSVHVELNTLIIK